MEDNIKKDVTLTSKDYNDDMHTLTKEEEEAFYWEAWLREQRDREYEFLVNNRYNE